MDPPYYQPGQAGSGAFGGGNRNYYNELSQMSDGISNDELDLIVKKLKKINLYVYCNKKQLLQYLTYFGSLSVKVNFNLLCWHKSNPIPATHNIYLRDTEYILFFREAGVKLYGTYESKRTYFISGINLKDKKTIQSPNSEANRANTHVHSKFFSPRPNNFRSLYGIWYNRRRVCAFG